MSRTVPVGCRRGRTPGSATGNGPADAGIAVVAGDLLDDVDLDRRAGPPCRDRDVEAVGGGLAPEADRLELGPDVLGRELCAEHGVDALRRTRTVGGRASPPRWSTRPRSSVVPAGASSSANRAMAVGIISGSVPREKRLDASLCSLRRRGRCG